jgi:hypothetical protein
LVTDFLAQKNLEAIERGKDEVASKGISFETL